MFRERPAQENHNPKRRRGTESRSISPSLRFLPSRFEATEWRQHLACGVSTSAASQLRTRFAGSGSRQDFRCICLRIRNSLASSATLKVSCDAALGKFMLRVLLTVNWRCPPRRVGIDHRHTKCSWPSRFAQQGQAFFVLRSPNHEGSNRRSSHCRYSGRTSQPLRL